MDNYKLLRKKIVKKEAKLCIIGLGYVGLPLAAAFAKKGYFVYGLDTSASRINKLRRGIRYIVDVDPKEVSLLIKRNHFCPTTEGKILEEADVIIVCVPTPLRKVKIPDVSYIIAAAKTIKKHMRRGQLIILESTSYPATTREVVLPILRSSGLKEKKDFFLCFSPERVNPGDKKFPLTKIPKIIGGISQKSSWLAKDLYSVIIKKVFVVSSPEVAETSKLLENTFRLVNIALANEFAMVCNKLGIKLREVIEAAKTKPFGFMPFYPGPGVGGHCLAGRESVLVRDEKGVCSVRFLNELFEAVKSHGYQKYDFKGIKFLKPKNFKILSFDLQRAKPIFKDIKLLTRRKVNEEVYKITTEGNRKVIVTDKHPMIVKTDSGFAFKWAKELKEKEEIPFALGLPSSKPGLSEIDVIKEIKKSFLSRRVRVKSKYFDWRKYRLQIKKLGIKSEDIHDYIRGNYLPLKYFIAAEKNNYFKISHDKLFLCSGRGPSYSEFPAVITLDNDFWRFIGYYLSEGCITEDGSLRVRITFNSDEKEYIDDVFRILDKKGIKYSSYKSKRWNSFHIKISSNVLGFIIKDVLSCGINSYTMRIPDILFSQALKCKIELLKGVLRGDGGIDIFIGRRKYLKNGKEYNHQHNTADVNYYSISDILFHQIVYLLQSIFIVPSFKKRDNLLLINGYEQMRKVDNFFLGDKRAKLRKYFDSRIKNIPLKNFSLYNNFFTARIKKIERVKTDYVYSAEVADTNTFVTSYGMIVHNCIPADPMYLSWKAKKLGFKTKMIDLAAYINHFMPTYVIERVKELLKKSSKNIKKAKILILGVTYKKDVKDLRESPSLDIIDMLQNEKIKVDYFDPLIPYLNIKNIKLKSVNLTKTSIKKYDCLILITDHTKVDYKFIQKNARLIFDTRNVYKKRFDNVIVL